MHYLRYLLRIIGIWLSAFSLGNCVGPTFAGFLVQSAGFPSTTIIFFVKLEVTKFSKITVKYDILNITARRYFLCEWYIETDRR